MVAERLSDFAAAASLRELQLVDYWRVPPAASDFAERPGVRQSSAAPDVTIAPKVPEGWRSQ